MGKVLDFIEKLKASVLSTFFSY